MLYREVSTDLNFKEREKEVEEFWKSHGTFQRSIDQRKGGPVYTFFDGPPTANGLPHIGHVLTRVIKDMIPRYRAMKGYCVTRKAGWDTHGLPVELGVERELGLDGKEQIEEYGLEPFVKKCKESVMRYKGMWEDFSSIVGYWADMEHPYATCDNDFIESEWWALRQIWDKGLLYKGFKIVPYCPRCGTPLSAQEVAQGYQTVKERSAVVRFKAVGEDACFLAWTTTPWTLPSNLALCVNPEETYCKVKAADGYTYYMAKALLDTVLSKLGSEGTPAYEVLEEMPGSALEGRAYEPLFACAGEAAQKQKKKAHFVTCDSYVTMSDGTGIVHIAPAFGEDDARVGKNYDLPFVQFVDGKGCLTAETPYEGVFVKTADPMVLKDLEAEGKLFDAPKFEHEYPHCWRCHTPLIYYARESWYIRETAVRDQLVRNNNTVNWIPESIGKGRFGNWLENIQDWAISRNRYWGTPLNIWQCECGYQHSVGSIAELKSMSGNCPEDIELHRPYIDSVTLRCPKCGGEMHRVEEVIDCWFDSGSMPFAQWHYPFENKEKFEENFPANFISEGVDQTRGWFHALMGISTLLFDKAPYENVIVLGHVQDKNGRKMSKSEGNTVDPFEALNAYGADAVRWYFYENSAPWLPNRFSGDAVVEGQRKFLGTLWNTYAFFVLYANIDNFDATKYSLDYASLPVMDKWLLSRLNTLIGEVDEDLANYKIPETARALQQFVDEMSNWYVRRCRERYWGKDMPQDKINAYMTLYTALVTVAKLSAPMIPFMSESIYRNLVCSLDPDAPESVHLCDFPVQDPAWSDPELEENMEKVLEIVTLGRAARNEASVKTRQPLSEMFISAEAELPEFFTAIVREEMNVKKVTWAADMSGYLNYTFKPQMKTLGPRFGKRLNDIRTALAGLDGAAAMQELTASGELKLALSDCEISLTAEDLLIEKAQTEGFASAGNAKVKVALCTALTPELIDEGTVREIVSKVQTMRKDADFNVTDHIRLYVEADEDLVRVIRENREEICRVVLGDDVLFAAPKGYVKDWNLNGQKANLGVERI